MTNTTPRALPAYFLRLIENLTDISFKYRDEYYDSNRYKHGTPFDSHSLVPDEMSFSEGLDKLCEPALDAIKKDHTKKTGGEVFFSNKWDRLGIAVSAWHMEARKELIAELEKAKEVLQEKKVNTRLTTSRAKEVKKRLRVIDKLIRHNSAGLIEPIVNLENAQNYARAHSLSYRSVNWTGFWPMLRFSRGYQHHLDILASAGVPNIEKYRTVPQKIEAEFKRLNKSHAKNGEFWNSSLAYLVTNGHEALEDFVRLMPLHKDYHRGSMMPVPNLFFLQFDKNFHDEVQRLGIGKKSAQSIPRIGTKHWGIYSIEGLAKRIMRASHDMYFSQLDDQRPHFKFAAVQALIEASRAKNPGDSWYGDRPTPQELQTYRKDKKTRDDRFVKTDAPKIIAQYDFAQKYPQLAQAPAIVAARLRNYESYDLKEMEHYGWQYFEDAITSARRIRPVLKNLGAHVSLEELVGTKEAQRISEVFDAIDMLNDPQLSPILSNPYFRKGFNSDEITYATSSKDAVQARDWIVSHIRLAKAFEDFEKTQPQLAQLISDEVYRKSRPLDMHAELQVKDFMSIAPNLNLKNQEDVRDALSEFGDYAQQMKGLSAARKQRALNNFRNFRNFVVTHSESDDGTLRKAALSSIPFAIKPDNIEHIIREGYLPTRHLMERLDRVSDIRKETAHWKDVDTKIQQGNFAANNELHLSLEYRRYQDHIKSVFGGVKGAGFVEFANLFKQNNPNLSVEQKQEIDYMCIEAHQLLQFILDTKAKSAPSGRDVMVVGNYTYGNVALLPIEHILTGQGIDVTKTKIGSTECHSNQHYLKEQLFRKTVVQKVLAKQPHIVVVDGTAHLEAYEKGARYPDAHQGFLNYGLAFNSALVGAAMPHLLWGHCDYNLDPIADRLQKELEYLRFCADAIKQAPQGYEAAFWNPTGQKMQLRSNRDASIVTGVKVDPTKPQLIITNTTMSHRHIKNLHAQTASYHDHQPAYFDDTDIARTSVARVTGQGVIYTNIMRDFAVKRYGELYGVK